MADMTDLPDFRGKIGGGTNVTCGHLSKPHYGRGMCHACYTAEYRRRGGPARRADCHPSESHYAKGLCERCWERKRGKRKRQKFRLKTIKFLGGKCERCGEDKVEFLTFHHSNKDGREHRSRRGPDGVCKDIRDGKVDARCLCANCHYAIDYYGGCPHKSEILESEK